MHSNKLKEKSVLHSETGLASSVLVTSAHDSHGENNHSVCILLLLQNGNIGVNDLVCFNDLFVRLSGISAQEVGETDRLEVEVGSTTLLLGDLGTTAVQNSNNENVVVGTHHFKESFNRVVLSLSLVKNGANLQIDGSVANIVSIDEHFLLVSSGLNTNLTPDLSQEILKLSKIRVHDTSDLSIRNTNAVVELTHFVHFFFGMVALK
mmetsp:Transcript_4423/g.5757  ORF Transcript_4423/g.5757 Transcript_4423/m.5757 type:complete len:207 (+) Transcript_4423:58-678(+)